MQSTPASRSEWCTATGRLSLEQPVIFGILNVTPDSFWDGGRHAGVEAAVAHASRLLLDGARVLDVGGESTRPGAVPISADEEIARVVPVIEAVLAHRADAIISIDTVKSVVARAAIDAGASIINDVSAFRVDPSMASVAASTGAGVVLMHSRGGVANMASFKHAQYDDVVADVGNELCDVIASARAAGIADDAIVLDPGLGFSKRTEHSVALLAFTDRIVELGYPVLVGPSRKRFIGDLAGGLSAEDRLDGTVAACCIALNLGARLFRVHDVAPVHRALAVAEAVRRERLSRGVT